MVPQRVSLVTIGAIHLPELRSFYQKLGWSETAISSDQYSVFETTGVLLSLSPIQELEKDDPENNCWEVTWNPTAVFDEKGAMITF